MSTPEQDRRWSVADDDQFFALDGQLVAMADTPQRARELVELLNAQEAGAVVAEARADQRIEDLRHEFDRHRQGIESHGERIRDNHARLLASLEDLASSHSDPGTEALGAIYEGKLLLRGHAATPADLIERVAEAIAAEIGHALVWDTPEGPCCDNTLGCGGHEAEPGCDSCATPGWPCETVLNAAKAALTAALALPAKDGARP